jgi:hypothetical protein
MDEDSLLERLRGVVLRGDTRSGGAVEPVVHVYEPATGEEIEEAERRLGRRLPRVLFTAYRAVANGGFGPTYSLLGNWKRPPRGLPSTFDAERSGRALSDGIGPTDRSLARRLNAWLHAVDRRP